MQGRSASGHDQIEELKRPAGVYALVTACQREKLLLLSRHRCLRKKRKERGLGGFCGPELPSGSASLSERLRYGRESSSSSIQTIQAQSHLFLSFRRLSSLSLQLHPSLCNLVLPLFHLRHTSSHIMADRYSFSLTTFSPRYHSLYTACATLMLTLI